MGKATPSPVHQQDKTDSSFDTQDAGGVYATPPAFELQATPVQRQEAPGAGATDTVQERYANHTLTAADLTDPYVTQQFGALSTEELFAYRRECTDEAVRTHITTLIDAQDRDPHQSYLGKQFTVNDANAYIRTEAGVAINYVEGDEIPEGRAVGQPKVIPNGTVVYITEVQDNLNFVFAEDWGWTSINNIQGGMFNETLSIDRAEHESTEANHQTVNATDAAIRSGTPTVGFPAVEPTAIIPVNTQVSVLEQVQEDNGNSRVSFDGQEVWTRTSNLATTESEDGTFEVTDRHATIRSRSVSYPTIGGNLTQGDRMIILGESQDTDPVGQYVQVAYTTQNAGGDYVRDNDRDPVWTAASNFAEGWADFKSDNARWRKNPNNRRDGVYLGQMDVVTLIGRDSSTGDQEVEKLSPELMAQYNTLRAAASVAGHNILLNSGWRSFPNQQELWDANPNPARVARPGRSNHQNGIAIDINTGGFNTAMYLWMRDNAPALGWTRTVDGEHWHWEYRPADAAAHGYRMPGVSP